MLQSVPSVLTVVTPASNLALLTLDELRACAGLTDGSQDTALNRLGGRIPADGATPPTLLQETLTETFRLNRWWGRRDHLSARETLILSRRPIVSITSVTEAGTLLDPTEYEIRSGAGTLGRLFNDTPARWAWDRIDVAYVAGWSTVPQGLKRAAEKLARLYWCQAQRDPTMRSEQAVGVASWTYWIGSPTDPDIPQDIMDDLGPYLNVLTG
jgi:hypothetical protein